MDICTRSRCEAVEEVVHQLRLQVADHAHAHFQINDGVRAATEIDGGHGQRFIHRHDEVASAVDPLAIAEGFEHRLTQHDADVLDRVMLIDVEIAGRSERQVEAAVPCEQLEHVVEEANPGPHVVAALTVNGQRPRDLRLGGLAIEFRCAGFAHRASLPDMTDSSASIAASV